MSLKFVKSVAIDHVPLHTISGDCDVVILKTSSESDVNRVTVTLSSSTGVIPVHSFANRVVYHVWDIVSIDLQISDTQLSKVTEWNEDPRCDIVSFDWYQNGRITATAEIESNGITFTATNLLPVIADKVSV